LLLGLGFALLFNRPFRGRQLFVPLMILPMIMSTMVVSAIWRAWFHYDYGFLNNVLRSVGLDRVRWLFDPDIALYSIVLVDVWQWTPMVFLILLAGLQSIPSEYYEAAQIDGATGLQVLWFDHAAADQGPPVPGGAAAHGRRVQAVRQGLRAHPRRSRHLHRERLDLHLP
jgi:ABC-type sugar transport system permease subunit